MRPRRETLGSLHFPEPDLARLGVIGVVAEPGEPLHQPLRGRAIAVPHVDMVARRAAHRVRAAVPVVLDEDDTRAAEYLRIELRCVGADDDLPGADTRKVRPIDGVGKLSGIDEM